MLYHVTDWDDAYANAAHIAGGEGYPARWQAAATDFRDAHPPQALRGGHLAARMICPGVLPDPVAMRVTACLPVSPLSDLRPLMRTAMNATLALDLPEALSESPALLPPREGIPVTVWVGGAERPEFLRQARVLADLWAGMGAATECVVDPGRHHFDVVDGLADPDSPMMRRLLG